MRTKRGILRIGTSNIVVPGSKETYPAEFGDKSRLSYYASLLNTVEINSTFRKVPRPSTFDRWYQEVPQEFQFTLKLSKNFTHVKKLKTEFELLEEFLVAADRMGDKMGCLLVQFPGSITSEFREKVEQLLESLGDLDYTNQWLKAVELRSPTWYTSETYTMLKRYEACMVLHDMPKSYSLDIRQKFPFYYFRYHGPKGDYRGSYTEEFLLEQAEMIRPLLEEGKDVYAYFNNTMGSAFENAKYLERIIYEGNIA